MRDTSEERAGSTVVRGLRWAWTRWTASDAQAPDVALVHGLQNDHTAWSELVPQIAVAAARITAVDLPGCGSSDPPPTPERGSITELALDLAELLRAERAAPAVLVGHSLGGGIALQTALDAPDVVAGIVLFAPVSTRGLDFVPAEAFDALAHPSTDDQRRLLRAAFQRVPDDATMATFEQVVLRADPRHIEGAALAMRDFHVESRLATIDVPVLLIAGDRDRHVPIRNHLATWAALRRAGLHVEHGVGHVPFVEAPDVSARLVRDFLARVAGSAGDARASGT